MPDYEQVIINQEAMPWPEAIERLKKDLYDEHNSSERFYLAYKEEKRKLHNVRAIMLDIAMLIRTSLDDSEIPSEIKDKLNQLSREVGLFG